MELFIIDPEFVEAHNVLYRGYNCLRPSEELLLEEAIALAYIEALTYTKAYNRLYLKTWVYQNQSIYPKLAEFFYNLRAEILQFDDFFDKGYHLELLKEIKQFGRQVVGKDLQDFWHFSKRFNAKIFYFEEIEKVFEINEADFVEPVEVAVLKTGSRVFIVYKLDINRKQLNGFDVKVSEGIYDVFEELGFEVLNTLRQGFNEEKQEVVQKLMNNNQGANYNWKFLNK